VARRFVEDHGGSLELSNERIENVSGAHFRVVLPLGGAEESAGAR
jgi:nitrogen fixation/metabolism regulation signal transduction histidine kinase